jgi:sugar phosphate isomerase/epimerase
MRRKILLGLTTTPKSDWKGKIREIDELGIKEVALFPTYLKIDERKELYALLEKTGLEKIPHVHLRDDAQEWELDYYAKKYGTELFNIHINETALNLLNKDKYKDKIFIENNEELDEMYLDNLNRCGGICLDVAHWLDQGIKQGHEGYDKLASLLGKYKVGCCHVSALDDNYETYKHYITGAEYKVYSHHWLDDMSQLDYVKKYVKYLPEYVSIELENPFKKQLEVKEYLEKIINPVE